MDKSPQSYVYDHPGRVEFQQNTPISNPNPENMVVPSSVEASQRPLKIIHSSYEALGQPPQNSPRTGSGSINQHGLPDNADLPENEKSRETLPAPSTAHPSPIKSTVPNTRSMHDYKPNYSLIQYKHD